MTSHSPDQRVSLAKILVWCSDCRAFRSLQPWDRVESILRCSVCKKGVAMVVQDG